MRYKPQGQYFDYAQTDARLRVGLIAHWMGDGSGNTLIDRSGYNNHGNFTLGPTWTLSKTGRGIKFEGGAAYVGMGNPASGIFDFTDSFSISFWIKTTQSVTAGQFAFILGKGYLGATAGYGFFLNGNVSSVLGVQVRTAGATASVNGAVVNDGLWHHIVGMRNHGGNTTYLYWNGNLVGSTTNALASYAGTSKFNIGDDWENANPASTFFGCDCSVDNVRVYKRLLSTAEIKQLFDVGNTGVVFAPRKRIRAFVSAAASFIKTFFNITNVNTKKVIGVDNAEIKTFTDINNS